MADYYRKSCGSAADEYLTGGQARQLYDRFRLDPGSDFDGDLMQGFHYWDDPAGATRSRVHVCPVAARRLPPTARLRLVAD